MLFGEWLKQNNDKYNSKFYDELSKEQLRDETHLHLLIMTSGQIQLMSDWKEYQAWCR